MMLWLIRLLKYDCSTPISPPATEAATRARIRTMTKLTCPCRLGSR